MNIRSLLGAASLTAVIAMVAPVQAQALTCEDLQFAGAVTANYPAAGEFCQSVVERDGKPYAQFIGEVTRIRGGTVHLKFKRPDGTYGDPVSFTPPANFRVRIEGRSLSVRSLSPRQELSIYIPEDEWVLAQNDSPEEFATATTVTTVAIQESSEDQYMAAATLPDTASIWPVVGLAGTGLVAFGGLLGWMRRRQRS